MKRTLKRILMSLVALVLVAIWFTLRRRSDHGGPVPAGFPPAPASPVHVEVHPPEPAETAPEEPQPEPGQAPAAEPAAPLPSTAEIEPAATEEEPPERPGDEGAMAPQQVVEPEAPPFTEAEPAPQAAEEPAPAAAEPDFMTSYFGRVAATADEDLVGHLAGIAEPGLELA
jgi:hypothetical protein